LASRNGKQETVRTLVELGVDKEAKTDVVRNLMMMMMMMVMVMMMTIRMVETMMILVDDMIDCI